MRRFSRGSSARSPSSPSYAVKSTLYPVSVTSSTTQSRSTRRLRSIGRAARLPPRCRQRHPRRTSPPRRPPRRRHPVVVVVAVALLIRIIVAQVLDREFLAVAVLTLVRRKEHPVARVRHLFDDDVVVRSSSLFLPSSSAPTGMPASSTKKPSSSPSSSSSSSSSPSS